MSLRLDIGGLDADGGTTLPEMDLPFAPNGTGGFRIPTTKSMKF